MVGYFGPEPTFASPFAPRDDEEKRKRAIILQQSQGQGRGMLGGPSPMSPIIGNPMAAYSGGAGTPSGQPQVIPPELLNSLMQPGGSGADNNDPNKGYGGIRDLSAAQIKDAQQMAGILGMTTAPFSWMGRIVSAIEPFDQAYRDAVAREMGQSMAAYGRGIGGASYRDGFDISGYDAGMFD